MSLAVDNVVPFKETGITRQYLQYLDDLHLEVEENNYAPIEVEVKLNTIHALYGSTLGFSLNDTKSHYIQRSSPSLDVVRAYTLKEILGFKNQDLSGAIVPRIITIGVNLLFAPAKKGKSRFIYFLLRSLIVTKEFLGFPTRRVGTILFYQLEEATTTVKKRLINNQFDDTENPNVQSALDTDQIIIFRSLDISRGIDQVKKDVKKYGRTHKVDLVIIDTLRAAMTNSTISENSADWAIPVAQLQNYGNQNNMAIVILHHMNKAGKASGTSALNGYANQLLELHSNSNPQYSDKALLLKTLPREGVATNFIIQGKRQGGSETLLLLEEEGVTAETLALQVRLINLLKQETYKEGCSPGASIEQIQKELQLDAPDKALIVLDRLQDSALVDSNRSGGKDFYYIPNYILDLYGSLGILEKSEMLEVKHQDISVLLQTATTKEDVNEAFKGLSKVDQDTVWGLLSQENQGRIRQILQDK